jgi:hypothetical protein
VLLTCSGSTPRSTTFGAAGAATALCAVRGPRRHEEAAAGRASC